MQTSNCLFELDRKAELFVDRCPSDSEDALGFRQLVKPLAGILLATPAPSVLAICGGWGSGKTSFSRFLATEILNTEPQAKVLYFNAWRATSHGAVLAALIARLHAELNPAFWKTWRGRWYFFAHRWRLRRAIQALSGPMHAVAGLGGLPGQVANTLAEAGAEIGDRLSREEQLYSSFERMCEALDGVAKPIVILDEIDRCPPAVAVSTIEGVRMLFASRDEFPKVAGRSLNLEAGKYSNPFRFIVTMDESYVARAFEASFKLPNGEGYRYISKFVNMRYNFPDKNWLTFVRRMFSGRMRLGGYLPPRITGDIACAIRAGDLQAAREARKLVAYLLSWHDTIFGLDGEEGSSLLARFEQVTSNGRRLNRDGETAARIINWALLFFFIVRIQRPGQADDLLRTDYFARFWQDILNLLFQTSDSADGQVSREKSCPDSTGTGGGRHRTECDEGSFIARARSRYIDHVTGEVTLLLKRRYHGAPVPSELRLELSAALLKVFKV